MQLKKMLSLPDRGTFSVIGGGGKTSVISLLAREFAQDGCTVLCTTTTHIAAPDPFPPNLLIDNEEHPIKEQEIRDLFSRFQVITCAKRADNPLKLCAPSPAFFQRAKSLCDVMLIEADGAKHLPFKAPASHEPVVLPFSDKVIGIAGIDALYQPIAKRCHRPEQVCAILKVSPETLLTPRMMAEVILSPMGYQKAVASPEQFALVLNKCDTSQELALAREVKDCLIALGASFPIALTSLHYSHIT